MPDDDKKFEQFIDRLRQEIASYVRRPEYGNLRYQTDVWETAEGTGITNLALVYDTPDGLTYQINVSFDHGAGIFSLVAETERLTTDIDELVAWSVRRCQAMAAIWHS